MSMLNITFIYIHDERKLNGLNIHRPFPGFKLFNRKTGSSTNEQKIIFTFVQHFSAFYFELLNC